MEREVVREVEAPKPRVLILVLLLASAAAAPFYPQVPLWAAAVLGSLLLLYGLPFTHRPARALIRADPERPVRAMLKILFVASVAIALAAASEEGAHWKWQQESDEARETARAAERQQGIELATDKVAGLLERARASLSEDKIVEAGQLLEEAATVPLASNRHLATELKRQVEDSGNAGAIRERLIRLSSSEFRAFAQADVVPDELKFDFETLTRRAIKLARQETGPATLERERRALTTQPTKGIGRTYDQVMSKLDEWFPMHYSPLKEGQQRPHHGF